MGERRELEVLVSGMCLGMKDFERGDGDTVPTVAMKGASELEWGYIWPK